MKICLIPARGGSKRIKNKNIKNFLGKPIIAWSIQKAKKPVVSGSDGMKALDIAIQICNQIKNQ